MSSAGGGFDRDTATKLLEAWKSGKTGADLKPVQTTMKDSMEKGAQLQQTGNTLLAQIARNTERERGLDASQNLRMIQSLGGNSSIFANELKNSSIESGKKASKISGAINTEMITGKLVGGDDKMTVSGERMKVLKTMFDQLGDSIPESIRSIFSHITSTSSQQQKLGMSEYQNKMEELKIEQSKIIAESKGKPNQQQAAKLQEINKNMGVLENAGNQYGKFTGRSLGVGQAAQDAASAQSQSKDRRDDTPIPNDKNHMQKINAQITVNGIVCAHCAKPIQQNPHAQIITGGAQGT